MPIAFDTILASHLLNEQTAAGSEDRATGLSLLNVAGMRLGVDNWGKGIQSFGDKSRPPTQLWGPDGMGHYCAIDTGYTHYLGGDLIKDLQEGRNDGLLRLLTKLVIPGVEAIGRMEENGIWVDFDRVAERRQHFVDEQAEHLAAVMEYVPEILRPEADIGNEHFLRRWLFGSPDEGGLGLTPVAFTDKKRQPQVDEKTLGILAEIHPAPARIVAMRKATKAQSFFDQWQEWADENWRLHPTFNPTGTVTGRRSCDSPNLQQVPRERLIRTCIGAPPGWGFLEVDYSQLEVRLAAIFAEEETMLRIFSDPHGDIYRYTAAKMLGKQESEVTKDERQKAKAVVLGFLYGMQAKGFVVYAKDHYGQDFTFDEAQVFRSTFFETYPGLVKWHERQKFRVRKDHQVTSPIGRIRHLWEILSTSWEVAMKAERQAINSPVQGMGGDMILASMVTLHRELDPDRALFCGDVHDALLFQVRGDPNERGGEFDQQTIEILKVMELPPIIRDVFGFNPPIRLQAEAKIGQYWGEGNEYFLNATKDGLQAA